MSVETQSEKQWIQESLRKLELLGDPQIEVAGDPSAEWPDWVYNLMFKLLSVSHPGVKLKNINQWTSKDLGRFLGRHYALVRLICGEVPVSPAVAEEAAKIGGYFASRATQTNPDIDLNQLEESNAAQMEEWVPEFKAHVQEIVASACLRPHSEASAFFTAFGRSMVMKPDELLTERTLTVNDKIAWAMVQVYPSIERLGSVSDLHQLLEQVLEPRGIKIALKQVEKFAQRIHLSFRDGPGRPKGSQNSDKSPRSLGVISQ